MRLFTFTAMLFIAFHLSAQDHFCGSTEAQELWFSKHPELRAHFDELQRQAAARDKQFSTNNGAQLRTANTSSASTPATYTIPMVFHILHTGGSENISDAQVMDAVSILNVDYRKLNADTNVVVNTFKNLIGDAKIEFRLATRDPNGNCTNGIIRHWDINTDWPAVDFNNYAYTWDPSMYLNVYVVKTMTGGAAGYTFLPGSGIPTNGDAVVILSTYIGSIGTGIPFTSRALTHEVGHWFNLQHPWGGTNQPGVACGDDGVSDTPITKGFSSCNLNNAMICTPGVTENVQNYMDYSYCSKMFTLGQVNRIQNAAASPINGRDNLSTSTNLLNTGLIPTLTNCIPDLQVSSPTYLACTGHALSVYSYTFNANPTNYTWTADNGATVLNPSAANTSVLFNNTGITTVNCLVSNIYGSSNKSMSFNVLSGVTQIISPSFEGFESGVVPAMWNVQNPTTPLVQWQITQDAAHTGYNSMRLAGDSLPASSVEILETPSYDFLNNPGAQFSFYYSYAKSGSSNKDIFKVQASKNCNGTWNDVWYMSNQMLADSSAGTTPDINIPGPSAWAKHDLINDPRFYSLSLFSQDNVRFRFYFQEDPGGSGYGNRVYVDDINFSGAGTVGIPQSSKSYGLNVYPNPSESSFNISFTLGQSSKISYEVVTVTGITVLNGGERSFGEGLHEITINENELLSKGVYILNVTINGLKTTRKLIVN